MRDVLGQVADQVKRRARRRAIACGLLAMAAATAASAQEPRELCTDRPGLTTPPCTVEAGRVQIEIGLADWTLDRTAATRTDTLIAGDTLLRLGLTDRVEARIGWTGYGHVRERDRATGAIDRGGGTGDVLIGVSANLKHPDGKGVSVALLPYATLPTGGRAIGSGTWGAGLQVPFSADLGRGVSLALTPEIDAAPDEDRHGRHLAYGAAGGFGYDVSDAVHASAELHYLRDGDPAGHSHQTLAGLAVAWQPSDDLQLDIGSNAGLSHASADVQLYLGVTRRF